MGPDELDVCTNNLNKIRDKGRVLIPELCLKKRIAFIADEISRDYPGSPVIHMLVVLTGSFVFAADLGRCLYERHNINICYHLIKTSVYDRTIKKSGEHYRAVKLDLEPVEIEGRDVIVVEDITDQGFTLTWLRNYLLSERRVSSVKICTLLDKRLESPTDTVKKLREELSVDYTGFIIPDLWIAGYGIDHTHEMRNVPFIFSLDNH